MQTKTTYNRSMLWLYIPLWLLFAYLFVQILGFSAMENTNIVLGGMYFVEFGVHEASHVVTAFLPAIMCAAAGSLGEVGFTILMAIAALKAKAYFALSFAMLWIMLAMNSAGSYMADARAQSMQLIGLGPDPQHDWHFVFGQLGWLDWDTVIGGVVRVTGDIIGFSGLIVGLALIVMMIVNDKK